METLINFIAAALLVGVAWVVFRILVRRDYQRKGRLTLFTSFLELLVWGLYMSFPYLYNPPKWVVFWSGEAPVGTTVRVIGVVCTTVGLVSAFGTMFWFGLRRAFGLQSEGLIQEGPYRVTRNPQLVGGSLLVIGSVVLWPSWYAVGWGVLYGVVAQLMVLTEEEHLRGVYGDEYAHYCRRVPRYVGLWSRRQKANA
jgi:protein-S-isoprenylcysteine O-methyltransferase Ste14